MKYILHLPTAWNTGSHKRVEYSRSITLQSSVRVAADMLAALKSAMVGTPRARNAATSSTSRAMTKATRDEHVSSLPVSHARIAEKDAIPASQTVDGMQRLHHRASVMRQIYM